MKNKILILLIAGGALLSLFAFVFAITVFSKTPTGVEAMVAVLAVVAAVTALVTAVSVYRRVNRPRPRD